MIDSLEGTSADSRGHLISSIEDFSKMLEYILKPEQLSISWDDYEADKTPMELVSKVQTFNEFISKTEHYKRRLTAKVDRIGTIVKIRKHGETDEKQFIEKRTQFEKLREGILEDIRDFEVTNGFVSLNFGEIRTYLVFEMIPPAEQVETFKTRIEKCATDSNKLYKKLDDLIGIVNDISKSLETSHSPSTHSHPHPPAHKPAASTQTTQPATLAHRPAGATKKSS